MNDYVELIRNKKVKPNFIIMGSQKSGTTSLYKYLLEHPSIFMSSPLKEPGYYGEFNEQQRYFAARSYDVKSRDELLMRFMLEGYAGEPLFGEASTYYTIGEYSRNFKVPETIYNENQEMKFIYIIRNPVARIVSNYLHCTRGGKDKKSLSEFMKSKEGKLSILTSMYYYQVEYYLKYFPLESFHFVLFEDLVRSPLDELLKIFKFLGVDKFLDYGSFGSFNTSKNRIAKPNDDLLFDRGDFKKIIDRILSDLVYFNLILNKKFDHIWDFSEVIWCKD